MKYLKYVAWGVVLALLVMMILYWFARLGIITINPSLAIFLGM